MYPWNLADPMEHLQLGIDPVITQLVLGTPIRRTMPGQRLLRNIGVDSWKFSYNQYGTEHFRRFDTERAMRAEIRTSDRSFQQQVDKLRRFTHATKRDRDELANASPTLRLRELQTFDARMAVLLDIEYRIRDLVTTAANYPVSHRLAISGGSEWNAAGGDSRADVRSMAAAIAASTGLSFSDLTVFLTEASLNAALEDPVFLASRHNYDTNTPSASDLAKYWGVGSVWSANPITADEDGVVSAMYGDVAIIYFAGDNPTDFDTTYGEATWAVNFRWNKGVALSPFYEEKTTTWWFPWQDYANPKIVNSNYGAIITNTAA